MADKRNPPTAVRNKRLKISPGGLVTLPVAARKSLGMEKGQGSQFHVAVDDGEVLLSAKAGDNSTPCRVSPRGMLALGGEARRLLSQGKARHYWVKLDDKARQIRLVPFQ